MKTKKIRMKLILALFTIVLLGANCTTQESTPSSTDEMAIPSAVTVFIPNTVK